MRHKPHAHRHRGISCAHRAEPSASKTRAPRHPPPTPVGNITAMRPHPTPAFAHRPRSRRWVLAWGLSGFVPAWASRRTGWWWGQVQHVTDGDTVWLRQAPTQQAVKVRLAGLDAPEICQHWGRESRQALASVLQRGRWVAVHPLATDVYGRTVAQLWAGGWDVSAWMVAQGHAWADPRDGRLMALQQQAQQAGRGLFASPAASPKAFRRWYGACQAA